jgi:hypothetical protein
MASRHHIPGNPGSKRQGRWRSGRVFGSLKLFTYLLRHFVGWQKDEHQEAEFRIKESPLPCSSQPAAPDEDLTDKTSVSHTNPPATTLTTTPKDALTEVAVPGSPTDSFEDIVPCALQDDGTHMIRVEVFRLVPDDQEPAAQRVETILVRASTILDMFADLTADRMGISEADQILCFKDTILRSFAPDFPETIPAHSTLDSVSWITLWSRTLGALANRQS